MMASLHLLSSEVPEQPIVSPDPVALQHLSALSSFVPGASASLAGALSSSEYVLLPPVVWRIFSLAGSVCCYQLASIAPSIKHHEHVVLSALSMNRSRNQRVFDKPRKVRYVQEM